MNVDKLSKKIESEVSKLTKAKFKKKTLRRGKLLSRAQKDIVSAAKYFSKMCRDRELCFEILVELMSRYRPDDVISWIQERVLSNSGGTLDIELQRLATELSIERHTGSARMHRGLIHKIRSLFKL